MKKEVLIALCDNIISKKIESISAVRGPRGLRGKSGDDFVFSDHETKIAAIINKVVESLEVEKIDYDKLSLNFESLSDDQKLELKGARGQRGKSGESFVFSDHEENIVSIINGIVDSLEIETIDYSKLILDFESLSGEQKSELKGPIGKRGKAGASFEFENEKDSISEIIVDHVNTLELKGEDGRSGDRGPRGQKGPRGRGFDFEENKESIHDDIVNYFSEIKDDLKLTYSELSEEEISNLKGKDGEVGEKGDRGARGQKGSRGSDGMSALEIWQEINDGNEEDFLASLRGRKGIDGLHGVNGKAGVDGRDGLNGYNGLNGLDAPVIVDIEIEATSDSHFRFVFYYSDNLTFKTNEIKLPKADNIQQFIMGGGSGGGGTTLNIEQGGVEVGPAETMDFSDGFDLTYDDVTSKVTVDYDSSITVYDEGVLISDQVNKINFIGDGITVSENDSISNWTNLEDLTSLDQVTVDPTIVNVVVDGTGLSKFTIKKIASEDIAVLDLINLDSQTTGRKAIVDTYEESVVAGIALSSALTGEEFSMVVFGIIESASFNFTVNAPLFLKPDGTITDTALTTTGKFLTKIGKSYGTGTVFIDIQDPRGIV